MDSRKRNITSIGLLTVLATVAFFWGLYYLLGNPVWQGGLDIVVRLTDGGGLKRGDRVYVSGVDVGLVQNVNVDRAGGVFADIRVTGDLELPRDTHAAIKGDVFGAHTIDLRPGTAPTFLEHRDTITGSAIPEITDLAVDLSARASSVLSAVDSLVSPSMLRDVHETMAILPSSAAELRSALLSFRDAADAIGRATAEFEEARMGDAVTGATEATTRTMEEIRRSAEALTSAAASMERSLTAIERVLGRIDRGEGTIGRLVNDPALHDELSITLREFRLLATDIRERPGRYINVRIF
jgi:phospholipid/cholesterol/gamma-HCH transport system substrate-binding protein